MYHSKKVFCMVLVTDNKAPEILDPGKKTFDLQSAKITPKLPAVMGLLFEPFHAMRRNHFNPAIIQKFLIKAIAVVCFILNELVRCMLGKTAVDGCFNQRHFMGRSSFHVRGDRRTNSVRECHDLGALATHCLVDSKTFIFAGTKVPSMKASRISNGSRYTGLVQALGRSWQRLLGALIVGTAYGTSGTADILEANPSKGRLFLKSRISRPGLVADRVSAGLAGLSGLSVALPKILWALSGSIVRVSAPS